MSLLDLLLDHPFADDDPLVHTVASSVTKAEMVERVERYAATLDVEHGAQIRIITKAGEAISNVEISDSMLPGMVSLPNGQGLSWPGADADTDLGVYLNELTSVDDRDWFAGTPHHKHVRARLEKV